VKAENAENGSNGGVDGSEDSGDGECSVFNFTCVCVGDHVVTH